MSNNNNRDGAVNFKDSTRLEDCCTVGDEPFTLDVDPMNLYGRNLRINMGACGGTEQASMPPYGWALLANLNNDGKVDFSDLAQWAQNFLNHHSDQPGDLDRNKQVNMADFALLAQDRFLEISWHVL